jgi:putative membrane protein
MGTADASARLSRQQASSSAERSSTELAVMRTVLASDRTLMAWVRTSTSLISFGFTIYKFFQYLRESRPPHETLIGPRGVGLIMIALGVGALVLATIEYRRETQVLYQQFSTYSPFPRSLAAGVAATVCGLGILGFVLVALHQ